MFRYNSKLFHSIFVSALLLIGVFAGPVVNAQVQTSEGSENLPRRASFSTFSLEYLSWEEIMRIDNGSAADHAYGQFFGNALTYEHETYTSTRSGVAFSGSVMFGKANAGGTQPLLTYQTSQNSWQGAMATARFAYRMTPAVTATIGPMALYRHIAWPDEGTGYSIKSGSDLNLGILGELGLRIVPKWEVRIEMGTLAFQASTFWSVGLGYKY